MELYWVGLLLAFAGGIGVGVFLHIMYKDHHA